jgi:alpha-aminoadipate carrier protein LysW
MVACPECETDLDVEVDDMEEGDVVSCAECGSDFEVITVTPLELNKVADEDEDEEDSDDEEEEEDGDY